MSDIKLLNIEKIRNEETTRIVYHSEIPEDMKPYLNGGDLFFEVRNDDIDDDIPDAILCIPYVACFLSLTMAFKGMRICVPTLERNYADSLPQICNVYKKMYPHVKWNFNIYSKKLEQFPDFKENRTSLFFTGGSMQQAL